MADTAVPLTGTLGNVKISSTIVAEITKWTFNKKVEMHTYASNATAGYKAAGAGPKSGTISLSGKFNSSAETQIDIGTAVTLLLFIDATRDYSVPCVIESLSINTDIDGGDWVSFEASASTNGAWVQTAIHA